MRASSLWAGVEITFGIVPIGGVRGLLQLWASVLGSVVAEVGHLGGQQVLSAAFEG